MGHASIVSGFIVIRDHEFIERAQEAIASFTFDDVWPFTNIFWCGSPAGYSQPVIGFTGSYKEVEQVWNEWLWKLAQLLTTLEAIEARVNLDCVLGDYSWELRPRAYCLSAEWPKSMLGQPWVIASAPEDDFSINPEWIACVESTLFTPATPAGALTPYKWHQFLERLPVTRYQ